MNPFAAFEVFTIGLITVALLHAWRRGTARVFELTAATAMFGVHLAIHSWPKRWVSRRASL